MAFLCWALFFGTVFGHHGTFNSLCCRQKRNKNSKRSAKQKSPKVQNISCVIVAKLPTYSLTNIWLIHFNSLTFSTQGCALFSSRTLEQKVWHTSSWNLIHQNCTLSSATQIIKHRTPWSLRVKIHTSVVSCLYVLYFIQTTDANLLAVFCPSHFVPRVASFFQHLMDEQWIFETFRFSLIK